MQQIRAALTPKLCR